MAKKSRQTKTTQRKRESMTSPAGQKQAVALAINKGKPVRERIAALARTAGAARKNDRDFEKLLSVLRDVKEPVAVRLVALQSLQTASFSVVAFESCSGEFRATLRKVSDDQNPELRQLALENLAQQKDGFAQKKLLEGLNDPEKALVPPEKALQLLSYDIHADSYTAARKIVANPPNPIAKREALRLLAADATAAPLFERTLLDKNELFCAGKFLCILSNTDHHRDRG
jgi:hypothetical protein